MINGVHALIYTKDADGLRAFFRDVLKLPSVDAGHGWLIFALPRGRVVTEDEDLFAGGSQGFFRARQSCPATRVYASGKCAARKSRGCVEARARGILHRMPASELP